MGYYYLIILQNIDDDNNGNYNNCAKGRSNPDRPNKRMMYRVETRPEYAKSGPSPWKINDGDISPQVKKGTQQEEGSVLDLVLDYKVAYLAGNLGLGSGPGWSLFLQRLTVTNPIVERPLKFNNNQKGTDWIPCQSTASLLASHPPDSGQR